MRGVSKEDTIISPSLIMMIQTTIDNTLGVLYLSVVVGSALYGVGCLQTWFYFRKFGSRDSWPIRFAVWTVLICDTAQMALITVAVYRYCVTYQGDPGAVARIEKAIIIELFFSGGIAISVQMFYCWRIWKFCGNWIIPGIVGVLGWISVVTLWIYSVIVVHFDDFVELVAPGPVAMSTIITSCAAGCDLAISAVMIFYLQRSKTGVRKSTDIINRMIIFTFNTGLPTSMSALLSLIALHAMSNTFIYIFFYLLTGRFYTNSLLVTLNARKYILEGSAATPRVGFNIPRNQGRGAQKRVRKESSLISIHFTRKTTEANENIPLPQMPPKVAEAAEQGKSRSTLTASTSTSNNQDQMV